MIMLALEVPLIIYFRAFFVIGAIPHVFRVENFFLVFFQVVFTGAGGVQMLWRNLAEIDDDGSHQFFDVFRHGHQFAFQFQFDDALALLFVVAAYFKFCVFVDDGFGRVFFSRIILVFLQRLFGQLAERNSKIGFFFFDAFLFYFLDQLEF